MVGKRDSGAKELAKRVLGTVSPGLLRWVQRARARPRFLGDPISGPHCLLLEPTTACNHRCVMCMDHSPRLASPTQARHLPFAMIRRLLTELAGMGLEELWLAGRGEPLLHPEAREIIGFAHFLNLRVSLTTNGSRLSEYLADVLCEAGLTQLSLSINAGRDDTYAEVHGTRTDKRRRVLRLLAHLSQRPAPRPRLLVSIVLSRANYRELVPWAEEALEAGTDGLVVSALRPAPFDMNDLLLGEGDWAQVRRDLAAIAARAHARGVHVTTDGIPPEPGSRAARNPYQDMACFIGHLFTVVDADGHVHGCCTCTNRLGSLGEGSFAQVWRSDAYRRYRLACREIPVSGLMPARCECHACGHVADNAALQARLRLRFPSRPGEGSFADRGYLAEAVCRQLGDLLPPSREGEGFSDLENGDVSQKKQAAALRLQGIRVMEGRAPPGGRGRVFEPHRIAPRAEIEVVLQRCLAAIGLPPERAEELVRATGPAGLRAEEMLYRGELDAWLRAVREAARAAA